MLIGTVVRITSGGKRKRYLIVVPGTVDIKRRGQVWRAQKRNRVYRIREYPLGVMPGQSVSFEDLEERKGRYWEAGINDYDPNKEAKKAAPKFTALEREVITLPKLPEARRENIVTGLEFLVDEIKRSWIPLTNIEGEGYRSFWENPDPERDPVTESIQHYVEGGRTDHATAYTAYRAILAVLTRRGSVHPGYAVASHEVDFARRQLVQAMSRQIDSKAFERLEAWVKYQRKLVRWDR